MKHSHNYNAILFDLDGTLLDTANDLGEALNLVLSKRNMPLVPAEKYRPVASDGSVGLLQLGFGNKLSNYNFQELRDEFLLNYQTNIAAHTSIYKGINTLLKQLNKLKIPWGIVTNKPIGLTLELLPHFEIFESCGVVVGGDSLAERKPHPAPLIYAASKLNVKEDKFIYVGDAPRDIEAGNRANMFTAIASWGYIAKNIDLLTWHADVIVDNPRDLLNYLVKY